MPHSDIAPSGMHRAYALPRIAWLIVGLLWPVALLNYLDRQMLATMTMRIYLNVPIPAIIAVFDVFTVEFLFSKILEENI